MNIPLMLRQVQAGKMQDAMATVKEALPLPGVLGRLCHHPCEQGCRRANWDNPAAIRDVELHVADEDFIARSSWAPSRKPLTGKSVAIIGSGPASLAAAFLLLRQGHACTIADRHPVAGGSLWGEVEKQTLPKFVLEFETRQLQQLGAEFRLGLEFGSDLTIEGLLRGFDAVLLAIGETSKTEGEALGLEMSGAGIKAHLETFQTPQPAVFVAGRAARNMNQLVRAMSDGMAAADCIDRYLTSKPVQRPDKPFSSIMGRIDPDELQVFLGEADALARVKPCDLCAGFNRREAAIEASRCLHCDCRSSGNCALQSYARLYQADAGRFKAQRRKFEQQVQPCGVIFEPGKCILCGICVKLTELAREPLGLTFIGRGFDVRVAAPFNRAIQDGLQKVAAECVEHCPTGALAFKDGSVR
jgi:NADPH-dependent glutamate synthase beta subunit-like oxidoreductase